MPAGEDAEDAEGNGEAGSDTEDKKKKTPNMNRLLKTRLQKLVDKTDDEYVQAEIRSPCADDVLSGRVLSAEFMELPNKKQWPIYYKLIKKPQCLENIFVRSRRADQPPLPHFYVLIQKRLKRKEYHAPMDFANDVELVFSNALEFNQEHTQIWEDAMVLRVCLYLSTPECTLH